MNYYYSDTHFNHENIIKYCGRPFANATEMNDHMFAALEASPIGKDDTLYFLGDFSSRNFQVVSETANKYIDILVKKQVAKLHIILGNHDHVFEHYLEAKRRENPGLAIHVDNMLVVKNDLYPVVLCHYPIESWNNMHHGFLHFFGHVHAKAHNVAVQHVDHHSKELLFKRENRYHVGVDEIGYAPLTMRQIIEKSNETRN